LRRTIRARRLQGFGKKRPTTGFKRVLGLIGSKLCSRVDLYGWSSGGGKYFSQREYVLAMHMLPAEHFAFRLLQSGRLPEYNVCIYGD